MKKNEVRRHYLSLRKAMSLEKIERESEKISELFFNNFDLSEVNYLHAFLPILGHHEINTWPIIQGFKGNTVISKSDFKNFSMESYLLDEHTLLEENKWGIPEPVNARPVHDHKIDMVLVPLLAFDIKGFRVGYGKGFYDRFFLNCRKNVIKVGLSLETHLENIKDVNEYDITLDYCVTPDKIYRF